MLTFSVSNFAVFSYLHDSRLQYHFHVAASLSRGVNSKRLILAYTSILITRFENDLQHEPGTNGTTIVMIPLLFIGSPGNYQFLKRHL